MLNADCRSSFQAHHTQTISRRAHDRLCVCVFLAYVLCCAGSHVVLLSTGNCSCIFHQVAAREIGLSAFHDGMTLAAVMADVGRDGSLLDGYANGRWVRAPQTKQSEDQGNINAAATEI